MSSISSLSYISPSLRDNGLYLNSSKLIDRVVERAFDSEIKILDSIYDPSNLNHIPEEVITMLGGEIFEKYIAGSIDRDSKVAFSQWLADFII